MGRQVAATPLWQHLARSSCHAHASLQRSLNECKRNQNAGRVSSNKRAYSRAPCFKIVASLNRSKLALTRSCNNYIIKSFYVVKDSLLGAEAVGVRKS